MVALQSNGAVLGALPGLIPHMTPSVPETEAFFELLIGTFGTARQPTVITLTPSRPTSVVMIERRMSQLLAQESSNAWALEQLSAEQDQLKKQLQQYADELNEERQHYNLPVPKKTSSGGYAIESFTLSSGGPSAAQATAPSVMDSVQAAATSDIDTKSLSSALSHLY